METLWSMSTTIREAERIIDFVETALEIDGQIWNKSTQMKYQILLIKNRKYLNDPDNIQSFNKLNAEQIEWLKNKSIDMTYEQAESIFNSKDYQDPAMRGRNSMSPLYKLGLVYIVDNKVKVTDVGKKLVSGEIQLGDFMLDSLLKFQYPNPEESGYLTWNTKPFINTLRLIRQVNEICKEKNIKEKGISVKEFGIFALSLKNYEQVENVANELVKFRIEYENSDIKDEYEKNYIKDYLKEFKNPEKNIREYTDNMIRYLRLTKYIYIRGKYSNTYIDLEPRRMKEIDSILEHDNGSAKKYSESEWREYMGTYGKYELPFETVEKLTEILIDINREINTIEEKLKFEFSEYIIIPEKEYLIEAIRQRREYRTYLQNLEIKQDFHSDALKIEIAIKALQDILSRNKANLAKKYSIELEKWTNIALNIINDAQVIKPNAPVGDDNEPTYTAPNGVPDIECFYDKFNSICEVTMLTSRDQWYNEGQPVMRHLREFENKNKTKPSYCLFVAPSLHVDTINTFFMSVKYEYQGAKQKIIPITIKQLIVLLETVMKLKQNKKSLSHSCVMELYDNCLRLENVPDSTKWQQYINSEISLWQEKMLA